MALFNELTASRVGGVKGFNATSESRIVRVIAEEADIDSGRGNLGSFVKYPDPRDLVEAQWARLGSGHPWDREGLKAGSYRIMESRGQGCWLVEVIYLRNDIGIGIPPTNEWLIRYRGATVTQHVLTELEPEAESAEARQSSASIKAVGLRSRRRTPATAFPVSGQAGTDPTTDLWTRPSEEVGSPAFKKVTEGATHWAYQVDDDGVLTHQTLRKVKKLTEEPRGMTVEDPAWLVTFERTLPNFAERGTPAAIAGYMKAVNAVEFGGAQPLQVKCLDITLDPIAADIPGQRIGGKAYRVVISFLWSFVPFGPHKIVPSWYDSDGHRATVFTGAAGNESVIDVEYFRNVRRADFNRLLAILERGR